MPTAPLHHGWSASQAMISKRVVLLLQGVLVGQQAIRKSPLPKRMSTRTPA